MRTREWERERKKEIENNKNEWERMKGKNREYER